MNGDNEVVKGPWAPTPWKAPDPEFVKPPMPVNDSVTLGIPLIDDDKEDKGERLARIRFYWSKVRQALKQGNLTLAAEWCESAAASEGAETGQAIRNLVGKLCRQEIER